MMNIRVVADSASQLKRKYLLALRLRPLGPLDWRPDWSVTRREHGRAGCLRRSHGRREAPGISQVRRLARLTVWQAGERQEKGD